MASNSRQPLSKKQKTDNKGSEENLQDEYLKLEEVQDKLEKLNEEAAEDIIKIEKRFNVKRAPFYKERNEVIKKIPLFWKKAFMNHEVLCDCLSENDQKVFDFVTELTVDNFDDGKGGYGITFKFKSNPWFKNDTLSKEFRWSDEGQQSVQASKIEWKEGEDPFKGEDQESFFSMWFKTDEEDSIDEVAEIIKEEIWPDPAKFFHGVLEELQGEGEGEGEGGEEDSDE